MVKSVFLVLVNLSHSLSIASPHLHLLTCTTSIAPPLSHHLTCTSSLAPPHLHLLTCNSSPAPPQMHYYKKMTTRGPWPEVGISQQTKKFSFPACETRTRIPCAGHDYSKLDMSEYPLAIWNHATEERVKVFTHQTDSSLLV